MQVTPESVLSWWDVVDRVGLVGMLLGQVALGWFVIFKYGKTFLSYWADWIATMKSIAEELKKNG